MITNTGLQRASGVCLSIALAAISCLVLSATSYKCDSNGRTDYSDEPCVGATHVDTTPTQGLDRLSGKNLKGKDVLATDHKILFADAVKPLTGMN